MGQGLRSAPPAGGLVSEDPGRWRGAGEHPVRHPGPPGARSDRTNDIEETFQYDRLDRLSLARVSSNTDPTEAYNHSTTYRYDLSGNITHKSDLGSYQYDQPYRLTSAGSRHQNYRYDANGNVTSGGGRRLTWSSFNKPTRMSQGGATTSFSYGPERHRYRRIDQLEGQTTTRLYLGKRYEQISTGDRTTHKYFIYAGDQLAAIHFDEVDSRGDQSDYQTRYLHTDALGSVDLITDGAGGVVDKLSFDPSGQRRTATWRSVQQRLGQASLAPLLTNRGFGGHEELASVGLVHMNGRVYDAKLGRFASADPHIQAPHNTQSYNRYTYVLNNPLKYTDPSGFFFKKIFKALGITKLLSILPAELLMVASIAAAVLLGPGGAWAIQGLSTITQGAIAGAVSGFIGSGGDLKAAVVGGLTGAAFAGIGDKFAKFKDLDTVQKMEKIALHGLTGGASSVANGGKFGAGFMSAGFTQAMSLGGGFEKMGAVEKAVTTGDRAKNAVIAGIVGGTASVIGGGKFANGAQTGAMSRLFNDLQLDNSVEVSEDGKGMMVGDRRFTGKDAQKVYKRLGFSDDHSADMGSAVDAGNLSLAKVTIQAADQLMVVSDNQSTFFGKLVQGFVGTPVARVEALLSSGQGFKNSLTANEFWGGMDNGLRVNRSAIAAVQKAGYRTHIQERYHFGD